MLGNYSDDMKYNRRPKDSELSFIQQTSKTLAGFAETFTDQSFLQGLSNLFKWVNKKDPYYLEQFLQMPVPGILSIGKDAQKYFGGEDKTYETKGFYDKLMNRLGFTSGLKERLDVFGRPKTIVHNSDVYRFDEDKHVHTLNGKPLTGVTSLIDKTLSKPALEQPGWLQYYGIMFAELKSGCDVIESLIDERKSVVWQNLTEKHPVS